MEALARFLGSILNLEINFFGTTLKPLYLVVFSLILVVFKLIFPKND